MHSCFQRYKSCKNRPKDARVISENKVFFSYETVVTKRTLRAPLTADKCCERWRYGITYFILDTLHAHLTFVQRHNDQLRQCSRCSTTSSVRVGFHQRAGCGKVALGRQSLLMTACSISLYSALCDHYHGAVVIVFR